MGVHFRDQLLAGLHIVVGMLVAGHFFAFITVVIAVIWFHERVVPQRVVVAITQKLAIGAEDFCWCCNRLATSIVEVDTS